MIGTKKHEGSQWFKWSCSDVPVVPIEVSKLAVNENPP